ncbi:MAG: EamA family transporter [Bifidobacteriaceae bacterium]|nr:EamA family transporter [Bifidobacteriaceae bacterium]
MTPARHVSFRVAVVLAIAAQFSVNAGSGFAVRAFEVTNAAAIVFLRNGLTALVLLAVIRPQWRGVSRRAWTAVLCYGISMAVMNSVFYEAINLIDVGSAVTVEIMGPLVLSVVLVRRWTAWLWAVLAAVGVAMLSRFDFAAMTSAGTVLAATAGVAWAGYIMSARWVGREFTNLDGLVWAMVATALFTMPRGVIGLAQNPVTPTILLWGLVVALTGTLIPYWFEVIALRGMSAATFGVMTALAPASAALLGWLIAGQALTWWVLGGMALVSVASAGAARGDPGHL